MPAPVPGGFAVSAVYRPGARDASARPGRVRGIRRPPDPLATLEPAMPAPVPGGFAVSAVRQTPETQVRRLRGGLAHGSATRARDPVASTTIT